MKRILFSLFLILFGAPANAESRIKDIVYFEGIRENVLIGYGLVVGLGGTGDNLNNTDFTQKELLQFLEKHGVNAKGANLKTKNIASVSVTATLPPFARAGNKITVDVSTMGDAKSLKGGTLIATPLLGADGQIYALAQGPISVGTMPPDDPTRQGKSILTNGFIQNGGYVEKEVGFELNSLETINLALKNPDISTARSLETAINSALKGQVAQATDPGTIVLEVPESYRDRVMDLLADIENITIAPDTVAKIVIDEATGTIVIGENVKVSRVAIAQGNLVVKVNEEQQFLFNIGALTNEPEESERGMEIATLKESTKLSDLVEGLNALGVRPKDLIAILKTIKRAGAMQAEIETR